MKTALDILSKYKTWTHPLDYDENAIIEAMHEYASLKHDPEPIDNLFKLKASTHVWVKDREGDIFLAYCQVLNNSVSITEGDRTYEGEHIYHFYESFLIAEVPKF